MGTQENSQHYCYRWYSHETWGNEIFASFKRNHCRFSWVSIRGHCYDGLVGIAGCDKSLPSLIWQCCDLMFLRFYGGSILPGKYKNKEVTVQDVFEAVGKFDANKISEKLIELEKVACPSAGSCGGQFTANTMACVAEAIGLAIPGSSSAPAPFESRDKFAFDSGVTVITLLINK